ncbi:MAG: hypothetical protein IT233_02985 [Bacteroidia bacterium]|nr:hypothetical protein [Bacteroidia bacterium]
MKKLIFSLGWLAAMSGASYGQDIHYKVLEDDPYNIKKLMIHLDPFYCDAWWTDVTLGWGVRADLHYGSLGTLNIDFRRAYLDVVKSSNKNDKDVKTHMWFEGVASLNLVDKTKQRSMKIVLSSSSHSSGGYTYTNTKFFMAPGTKRKIFGVRGGIYMVNTPYETEDAHAYKLEGVDTSRATGAAMMKTMTIVGGISFKSITNLQVSVDDWGTRRNSAYSDFYIDFLFAPGVGMGKGDVTHPVSGIVSPNADLDVKEKKHMGWRMGWSYKNPMRTWLTYKFEWGSRPGFKSQESGILSANAFLMMTMGISIPFNVKF